MKPITNRRKVYLRLMSSRATLWISTGILLSVWTFLGIELTQSLVLLAQARGNSSAPQLVNLKISQPTTGIAVYFYLAAQLFCFIALSILFFKVFLLYFNEFRQREKSRAVKSKKDLLIPWQLCLPLHCRSGPLEAYL